MEKETFVLETENGNVNCEVILRFYSEKYKKNYLVYTDHSLDNEKENVFVSSYLPLDSSYALEDITDLNELNEIENHLEEWGVIE